MVLTWFETVCCLLFLLNTGEATLKALANIKVIQFFKCYLQPTLQESHLQSSQVMYRNKNIILINRKRMCFILIPKLFIHLPIKSSTRSRYCTKQVFILSPITAHALHNNHVWACSLQMKALPEHAHGVSGRDKNGGMAGHHITQLSIHKCFGPCDHLHLLQRGVPSGCTDWWCGPQPHMYRTVALSLFEKGPGCQIIFLLKLVLPRNL